MKRRSFLKSLFAALVSVTLARELTAAAPEKPDPDPYEGLCFVEDPLPVRLKLGKDGYEEVKPYLEYREGSRQEFRWNPEYFTAPVEVELWRGSTGAYALIQRERATSEEVL